MDHGLTFKKKKKKQTEICLPAIGEGPGAPAGKRVGGFIWAHSGGRPGPTPQAQPAVSTQPGTPSPMHRYSPSHRQWQPQKTGHTLLGQMVSRWWWWQGEGSRDHPGLACLQVTEPVAQTYIQQIPPQAWCYWILKSTTCMSRESTGIMSPVEGLCPKREAGAKGARGSLGR